MQPSPAQSVRDQPLLEYTSPQGPLVTHVRGTVLADAQQNLRSLGIYERYLDALSPQTRDNLSAAIASSWIDMASALEHYTLIERLAVELALSQQQIDDIATRIVTRATDT